jgi:hypothetical protein
MRFCQALLITIPLLIAGCSRSGPALAPVTGVVLLDGQPLANARVVFQPLDKNGSPSFAETSDKGQFVLVFNRDRNGALLGQHQVQVTVARLTTDPSGNETVIAEKIPMRYNTKSELKYDVKSSNNKFEIKLDSRGPVQQPGTPKVEISC